MPSASRRQTASRALAIAAVWLLVSPGAGAYTPRIPQPAVTPTTGIVIGTAWREDTLPYPQAPVRLRNVETGRGAASTIGDKDGRFRFERVEPGAYVVELLSNDGKVLAVGDLFGVTAGGQASTSVRLSSKAPWVGGFFGNAAAAAIAAASTLGVTAVGSSGSPASGQ
jgi:hypothetical protein